MLTRTWQKKNPEFLELLVNFLHDFVIMNLSTSKGANSMKRYIVTLTSSTSTRKITVAADGIIDAGIKADAQRNRGERVTRAIPYEQSVKITCC